MDGSLSFYPLVEYYEAEETHKLLYATTVVDDEIEEKQGDIKDFTINAMQALSVEGRVVPGVYALEFLQGSDGSLVLCEIAPRTHNSGHGTDTRNVHGVHGISQHKAQVLAPLGIGIKESELPSINMLTINLLSEVSKNLQTQDNLQVELQLNGQKLNTPEDLENWLNSLGSSESNIGQYGIDWEVLNYHKYKKAEFGFGETRPAGKLNLGKHGDINIEIINPNNVNISNLVEFITSHLKYVAVRLKTIQN